MTWVIKILHSKCQKMCDDAEYCEWTKNWTTLVLRKVKWSRLKRKNQTVLAKKEQEEVIQNSFTMCSWRECNAQLTSMRRTMCCNSPGGPIPPGGYTEQEAETLPEQLDIHSQQDRCSFSKTHRESPENINFSTRSSWPCLNLPTRRWTTLDIAGWIKIGFEWAKHMHTHKHEDREPHTNTHFSKHIWAESRTHMHVQNNQQVQTHNTQITRPHFSTDSCTHTHLGTLGFTLNQTLSQYASADRDHVKRNFHRRVACLLSTSNRLTAAKQTWHMVKRKDLS